MTMDSLNLSIDELLSIWIFKGLIKAECEDISPFWWAILNDSAKSRSPCSGYIIFDQYNVYVVRKNGNSVAYSLTLGELKSLEDIVEIMIDI